MATNNAWSDFENLRHTIKHNTVDKLKQILTGFNDQCQTVCVKSGKKQDLIDRIVHQMDSWRQSNNIEKWVKAQAILHQVRTSGVYLQHRPAGSVGVQPMQTMTPASYGSTTMFPATSTGRYDPYAPPRVPPPPVSAATLATVPKPAIRFKSSPFLRIDQSVSAIAECPESTSSTDRKQQNLTFTLNSEQTMKLTSTSAKYQLRLYCTTSTFYNPNQSVLRPAASPCPIEFPPTCEVRVNGTALQANLKGLKKKPGTAPPADLGRMVRMNGQNRVEMVYVNSQQPVQPKKFYMTVSLVEVTTVAQLVDKLKKGKYRSNQDILATMFKSSSDDEEIVAGPQKMSLKCPLSFMRVRTPCRSTQCVHPQCFDATSWFSCMEQTTTWLCPVCERALNPDDLIIDGYFDQILKETEASEDVDDVIVENDGQWHTSDNKFASPEWRVTHPVVTPHYSSPPRESSPASADEEADARAHARKQIEILVLDSDDEDEGRVKRELSVSHSIGSGSVPKPAPPRVVPAARGSYQEDVIDLTGDSEDEQPRAHGSSQPQQPLPRPSTEKRKAPSGAPSPTEQIWKKSRVDAVTPNPQSIPSTLPPISPSATRSPIHCGPAGQFSPTTYPGPQLPPLRLQAAYAGQAGGNYISPVGNGGTAVGEGHRGSYEQYGGNYNYGHTGGSVSRSGVWP